MAVKVDLSEEIERPVEVVFRWYADDHVRNHPRWDPNIELWLRLRCTDRPGNHHPQAQ
jgi:hypothetical protein